VDVTGDVSEGEGERAMDSGGNEGEMVIGFKMNIEQYSEKLEKK
jgi:hypothetical protein